MLKIGFILDLHGRINNPISRVDNYPQAILDKVEYVLKDNNIIVFCGDIFNTYLTGIQFINKLLQLLCDYTVNHHNKFILTIPGNHDLKGRNYDSWLETSYGTLTIGRGWNLQFLRTFNNQVQFIPLTFDTNGNPVIPEYDKNSNILKVLVGHAYFNHPEYNDKWHITSEFFDKYTGLDYCILGHDHQEYPIEQYNGCKLLRCGSISRATIDDRDRTPKYIQLVIQETAFSGTLAHECKYIEIPHKAQEDVFKDNTGDYSKDIQNIINLLKVNSNENTNLTTALKQLKCPKKYQELIQEILHE